MITIVVDLNEKYLNQISSILKNSRIIYGLSPDGLPTNKFQHIYNKDFFIKASNDYVEYVNENFLLSFKSEQLLESVLLDAFEPFQGNVEHIAFLITEICRNNVSEQVVFISSDCRYKVYFENNSLNFGSHFEVKFYFDLKTIILLNFYRLLKGEFFYQLFNIFSLFIYIIKILKHRGKSDISKFKNKVLFLSRSFKYWDQTIVDEYFMDRYYSALFYKLTNTINVKDRVTILVTERAHKKSETFFSIFGLISFRGFVACYFMTIKALRHLTKNLDMKYLILNPLVAIRIFMKVALEKTLIKINPLVLIYYDEVYWWGKMISFIANNLGIKTYGYQHALDSQHHVTYKTLKLFKKIPYIFPNYFFIYGNYSKKLFSEYGYDEKRLIEIGFDRISTISQSIDRESNYQNVLYIGQNKWVNDLFEIVYQIESKNLKNIYFRPHPLIPIDKELFQQKFPKAILIDVKKSTLDEDIQKVDCIIGCFSTSLINAVLQKKAVVCYLPYGLEDLNDFRYWGIQTVTDIKNIDRSILSDQEKLLAEITPKIDALTYIKDLIG